MENKTIYLLFAVVDINGVKIFLGAYATRELAEKSIEFYKEQFRGMRIEVEPTPLLTE